jgi:hypothetical protein
MGTEMREQEALSAAGDCLALGAALARGTELRHSEAANMAAAERRKNNIEWEGIKLVTMLGRLILRMD